MQENILVWRQQENEFSICQNGRPTVYLYAPLSTDLRFDVSSHYLLFCSAVNEVELKLCWFGRKVYGEWGI